MLGTIGAQFPHCVPQLTKDRVYRAALDAQHAIGYNKERLQIPFINGAPGIGKTRMLLESLNILKVLLVMLSLSDSHARNVQPQSLMLKMRLKETLRGY